MTNALATNTTNRLPTNVIAVTPGEIVSPRVLDFAERYKRFTKATAENISELAKTIVEAKRDLSPADLCSFYHEIRLDPKSSTYRKLAMIGENAERFAPHLDKMPTAWTTVYNLAKMPEQTFEKVVTDDRFSPSITAKKLIAITGVDKKIKARPASVVEKGPTDVAPRSRDNDANSVVIDHDTDPTFKITLDLSNLDNMVVRDVCDKLTALKLEKRFNMSMSKDLIALVDVPSPAVDPQQAFQLERAE